METNYCMKIFNGVMQYVKDTKRFQSRAVVAEDTEERNDEAGGGL